MKKGKKMNIRGWSENGLLCNRYLVNCQSFKSPRIDFLQTSLRSPTSNASETNPKMCYKPSIWASMHYLSAVDQSQRSNPAVPSSRISVNRECHFSDLRRL